jgi:nuclear pore complex protein Nup54
MFAPTTPATSAQSTMTPFTSTQPSGALLTQNPLDELEQIARQWDPNSAYCQFRHVFYNIVPPQHVLALRERRPEKFPEKLWQYALQNVPDPQCMIPVQAIGFKELKLRVSEQDKMSAQHSVALKNIQALISQLMRQHELETTVKLDQYRRMQMSLAQRVIRVMKKKELLANQGWHTGSSEEQYKTRCETLLRELNKPHQYKTLLNDLQATVTVQHVMQNEERQRYAAEPIDEETLDKIAHFLNEQRQGLKVIMDLLTTDAKQLQSITEQLNETENRSNTNTVTQKTPFL